ncbi:hypothetical protein F5Y13DRAFT_203103 [Hypoxylon sp. FL1857]|nr:hypothetical protein F5Y13DRAFT_203103 [Hypoxylon sp. FL1857]
MDSNQQRKHSTSQSSFTRFCDLPKGIQAKIWKAALPERKAGYILLSNPIQILQAPPAIYHACQQSRRIALEQGLGGIYQLEDGRRTWFCKETNYFLYSGFKLGLGELACAIQNVVIPRGMLADYNQACEAFEILLTDGELTELQNIYVDLGDKFTILDNSWDHITKPHLFKSRKIVVPDLNWYDEKMRSIDEAASILPNNLTASWKEYREIAFDDDDEHEWKTFNGDVKYALMSTMARLSNEIRDEQYDAFEAETLMHPTGVSWWEFLAFNSPDIWPTCIFMNITGSERVYGVTREMICSVGL